ncbi:MAG: hypothetical protein R3245_11575 [Kiloniellales bacterium]|nr:hypothetical protein [Kiloniellales bacterium]
MKTFEQIFEKVAKPDASGNRVIHYASEDDLVFIYASGFVDAKKCSLDEWIAAFDDSKQKDGSYDVTYKQWMAKEKFYYTGPVREPFDAMKIPEKEYTEAEFTDMWRKCIIPSSQSTEEKIPRVLQDLKGQGILKDGKINVDVEVKKQIGNFLLAFPSPLRVLEIKVQQMLRGEVATTGSETLDAMASGYARGPTKTQTTQDKLSSLLGGHAKPAQPAKKPDEELSVKDLQKKVKNRPV